MRELIKIKTNENNERVVSARELYEGLKIEKAFSTWIQNMLDNIDAIENIDFFPLKEESSGGRPSIEYVITADIAKEICMVVGVSPRTNKDTKQLSKDFRKYFIEKEKELREIKNNIPKLTERDSAILGVMNANSDLERVGALKQFEDIVLKPLLAEINHKEDVIVGLVDNIDLATKRQRITQIIRHGGKGKYRERYNLLYQEFEKKYHMNLNRRIKSCEIKPKVKNKMDYIDRVLNKIPELYEIVCKLFENEIKELIKEWEEVI